MSKIKKLWVIDDDEIYCFAAKRIIKKAEIAEDIMFFENGQVAIDFLREHMNEKELLPELIFLDINMPILDGWQFLQKLSTFAQELPQKITIYVVSSSIASEDHDMAKASDLVSGFIVKPYSSATLSELFL